MTDDDRDDIRLLGRYELHRELASGGMATVHLGRLLGPIGFSRAVAIKRLHRHYARDPQFVAMFLDEARLAARVRHQNVVPTLDVVAMSGELLLVMEYVQGEALSRLLTTIAARGEAVPPSIAVAIILGALEGLHAAHEAKSEVGQPLDIVHRDMSPQNVIVGVDGVARMLDFGVAKATGRLQSTQDGQVKGKMAYMSPEQLEDSEIDRRSDIWAASVVFWEMLAGRRLYIASSHAALIGQILLDDKIPKPSEISGCTPVFDALFTRGLNKEPEERFQTAREMALAIEKVHPAATARAVGEWVELNAGPSLEERARLIEDMEAAAGSPRKTSIGTVRTQLAALGVDTHTTSLVPPSRASRPRPPSSSTPPPEEDPTTHVTPPKQIRPSLRSWWIVLALIAASATAYALVLRTTAVGPVAPNPPALSLRAPAIVTSAPVVMISPTGVASHDVPLALDAGPALSAAVVPPRPRLVPVPIPSASSLPSAKVVDCNPPYTTGPPPDYIRHPKRECLVD